MPNNEYRSQGALRSGVQPIKLAFVYHIVAQKTFSSYCGIKVITYLDWWNRTVFAGNIPNKEKIRTIKGSCCFLKSYERYESALVRAQEFKNRLGNEVVVKISIKTSTYND